MSKDTKTRGRREVSPVSGEPARKKIRAGTATRSLGRSVLPLQGHITLPGQEGRGHPERGCVQSDEIPPARRLEQGRVPNPGMSSQGDKELWDFIAHGPTEPPVPYVAGGPSFAAVASGKAKAYAPGREPHFVGSPPPPARLVPAVPAMSDLLAQDRRRSASPATTASTVAASATNAVLEVETTGLIANTTLEPVPSPSSVVELIGRGGAALTIVPQENADQKWVCALGCNSTFKIKGNCLTHQRNKCKLRTDPAIVASIAAALALALQPRPSSPKAFANGRYGPRIPAPRQVHDNKWVCVLGCGKEYTNKSSCSRHQREKCELRPKVRMTSFDKSDPLPEPELVDNRWKCSFDCGLSYANRCDCVFHQRCDCILGPMLANIDGKPIPSWSLLDSKSSRQVPALAVVEQDDGWWKCAYCPHIVKSRRSVDVHMGCHCKMAPFSLKYDSDYRPPTSPPVIPVRQEDGMFRCGHCDEKTFSRRSQAEEHQLYRCPSNPSKLQPEPCRFDCGYAGSPSGERRHFKFCCPLNPNRESGVACEFCNEYYAPLQLPEHKKRCKSNPDPDMQIGPCRWCKRYMDLQTLFSHESSCKKNTPKPQCRFCHIDSSPTYLDRHQRICSKRMCECPDNLEGHFDGHFYYCPESGITQRTLSVENPTGDENEKSPEYDEDIPQAVLEEALRDQALLRDNAKALGKKVPVWEGILEPCLKTDLVERHRNRQDRPDDMELPNSSQVTSVSKSSYVEYFEQQMRRAWSKVWDLVLQGDTKQMRSREHALHGLLWSAIIMYAQSLAGQNPKQVIIDQILNGYPYATQENIGRFLKGILSFEDLLNLLPNADACNYAGTYAAAAVDPGCKDEGTSPKVTAYVGMTCATIAHRYNSHRSAVRRAMKNGIEDASTWVRSQIGAERNQGSTRFAVLALWHDETPCLIPAISEGLVQGIFGLIQRVASRQQAASESILELTKDMLPDYHPFMSGSLTSGSSSFALAEWHWGVRNQLARPSTACQTCGDTKAQQIQWQEELKKRRCLKGQPSLPKIAYRNNKARSKYWLCKGCHNYWQTNGPCKPRPKEMWNFYRRESQAGAS